MRLARVLGAIGRTLITLGVLILLFVVYQLWGTGIREAQAQRSLENEFEESLGEAGVVVPDESAQGSGQSPPTTATPGSPPPPPAEGDASARIRIPDIGVDKIVVEGVTLTACHPKYSARQRIIVVATLVGEAAHAPEPAPAPEPVPAPATGEIPGEGGENGEGAGEEPTTASIDGGLSGERAPAWPAIALGFACACIWLAAWLLGKLWQAWPAYLLCLPLFLLMLFFFFENFSRLLPANF